jgi:hypothetical protein
MLSGMKACLTLVTTLLLACGRQPPTTAPGGSDGALPAPSVLAQQSQTPTTDPAPGSAQSTSLTVDECRSRPGEVLTDKGDGSLHERGCPDGRRELGKVRVGIENGLCCAPVAAAAAPAAGPVEERAPCTSDHTCNDDASISALWGKCNSLGVCECKPGFERNPRGRCQKGLK